MHPFLPTELIDYILKFNEEWKIIGNRFVHIKKLAQLVFIKKLLQIPRPKHFDYFGFGVFLPIFSLSINSKSYLMTINDIEEFSIFLFSFINNTTSFTEFYYLDDNQNKWKTGTTNFWNWNIY